MTDHRGDQATAIELVDEGEAADRAALAALLAGPEGQRARDVMRAAKAQETRRAYAREVASFEAWCYARGLSSLPAHPDVVAVYVVHMSDHGRRPAGIDLALAAISGWHKAHGHASPRGAPQVKAARAGVRNTQGTRQRQAAPLGPAALRAAIGAIDDARLDGKRDRALLALGFAGAFRRSELAGLDVSDVRFMAEGARITLRKSKTDQEGRGQHVDIPLDAPGEPVAALRAWLDASGRASGPLFVAIDRWGRQSERRMCGRSIGDIIKQRARAALGTEADGITGHSLRAGLATAAAEAGRGLPEIMAQTRHRDSKTVLKYIRSAGNWQRNAAKGL